MLNATIMSVIGQSVVILTFIMLSVTLPSIVMLTFIKLDGIIQTFIILSIKLLIVIVLIDNMVSVVAQLNLLVFPLTFRIL